MRFFANAFLVAFLADGFLSLIDEVCFRWFGTPVVSAPRVLSSVVLGLAAPVLFCLLGLTPRLPKRIILPLILYTGWAALSGMPLPVYLPAGTVTLLLAAGQLGLGLLALSEVRRVNGGESRLLTGRALRGPTFRWSNTVGFFGTAALLGPAALLLYAFVCLHLAADHLTAGYIRVAADGVYSRETVYVRGEDAVHLIGMMHIGDRAFYRDLLAALPEEDAVVLLEGVTDREGRIREGFSYQRLASALGLESQEEVVLTRGRDIRRADVDAGEFSPVTVDLLNRAAEVLESASIPEALEAYSRFSALAARDGAVAAVEEDLIRMRNRRLLEHLDIALGEFDTVVVPWGAAHMPGIEEGVRERGFTAERTRERQVIDFWGGARGDPKEAAAVPVGPARRG